MIFLRAIPFSFDVLWRLALVFPFMLIALAALGAIAGFLVTIFLLTAPLVALLIGIFFAVGISAIPTMVGARLGLRGRGATARNSAFGLLFPAIGYGLFEAICVLLVIALGLAGYAFAMSLTLEDIFALGQLNEEQLLAQVTSVEPAITLSIIWVCSVLILSIRAALLVPLAGASIGVDPTGQPHTPFYGFGSGFFSMLVLVFLSYLIWTFTVPLTMAVCTMLGFDDALMAAVDQLETVAPEDILSLFGVETGVFMGLLIFFYLWAFSLQCAGAVLVYLKLAAREADAQNAFDMSMEKHLEEQPRTAPQREIQSQDVMELIRSRMQQNK